MKRPARALLAALLLALCLVAATVPATAASPPPVKRPVATGTGGAIATVDLDASAAGLEVLRHGGNAVDAAVAAAATLGVTEAYSAGIGGGGFMVVYLAGKRRVVTIDGRETAPAAFREDSFIDPATGAPIPFAERVTSGLGVGVPGTLATWQRALRDYGTRPLGKLLGPAIRVAERGFVVDQTFHDQTASNAARFAAFPATAALFLPGGAPPAVGSVLRNPDLARTYRLLARHGTGPFYRGRIAEAIAGTVQDPPVDPASTLNVRPGVMTEDDLAAYRALDRPPTRVGYRGHQVYGMGPPSSG
ncbi:MAG TPA: gamma-glutamyltransferase, partial [Actinomycetota bacterium]|nr:gamma-glutamyltransferase [Actinomycetota bacterium]